jgi:hypothetical protein
MNMALEPRTHHPSAAYGTITNTSRKHRGGENTDEKANKIDSSDQQLLPNLSWHRKLKLIAAPCSSEINSNCDVPALRRRSQYSEACNSLVVFYRYAEDFLENAGPMNR